MAMVALRLFCLTWLVLALVGCTETIEPPGLEGERLAIYVPLAIHFAELGDSPTLSNQPIPLRRSRVQLFPSPTRESERLTPSQLAVEVGEKQNFIIGAGPDIMTPEAVLRLEAQLLLPAFVCATVSTYFLFGAELTATKSASRNCTPIPEEIESLGFDGAAELLESMGLDDEGVWPEEVHIIVDTPQRADPCETFGELDCGLN